MIVFEDNYKLIKNRSTKGWTIKRHVHSFNYE